MIEIYELNHSIYDMLYMNKTGESHSIIHFW